MGKGWRALLSGLAAVVLIGLVVTTAILQYRWIGRISNDESEKLHAFLSHAGQQVGGTLAAEGFAIRAVSSVDAHSMRSGDYSYLARQLAFWRSHTSFPSLIKSLYVFDGSGSAVRAYIFKKGTIRTVIAPSSLTDIPEDVKGQVDRMRSEVGHAVGPSDSVEALKSSKLFWYESIVSPVFDDRNGTPPVMVGFTVVNLDTDYLIHFVIPTILGALFNLGPSGDYHVTLLDWDHRKVLYRAPEVGPFPGFSAAAKSVSDGSAAYVMPISAAITPEDETRDTSSVSSPVTGEPIPSTIATPFMFFWAQNRLNPEHRTDVSALTDRVPGRNVHAAQPATGWQLVFEHRSGSLDQAIAATRNRNLILSLGIVALLALSLLALLLLYRRERNLVALERQFIHAVSHELRTPLTVMYSSAENLAEGLIRDPKRIEVYGRMIRDEGKRLASMIEKVLAYSGVQVSRDPPDRSLFRPDDIIRRSVAAYAPEARSRGIEVAVEIDPDVQSVRGDPEALRIVFDNLISNALKHGFNVDPVANDASDLQVTVSLRRHGHMLQLLVSDNGKGIPRQEIRRVFQPFYRGGRSTAGQIPGAGLGLSLVQRVVLYNHGTVQLNSGPRSGTVFVVELPFEDDSRSETTQGPEVRQL